MVEYIFSFETNTINEYTSELPLSLIKLVNDNKS